MKNRIGSYKEFARERDSEMDRNAQHQARIIDPTADMLTMVVAPHGTFWTLKRDSLINVIGPGVYSLHLEHAYNENGPQPIMDIYGSFCCVICKDKPVWWDRRDDLGKKIEL